MRHLAAHLRWSNSFTRFSSTRIRSYGSGSLRDMASRLHDFCGIGRGRLPLEACLTCARDCRVWLVQPFPLWVVSTNPCHPCRCGSLEGTDMNPSGLKRIGLVRVLHCCTVL